MNVTLCTVEQAGRMLQQVVSFLAPVGLHQTVLLVSHASLLLHVMKRIPSSAGRLLMRLLQHAVSLVRQDRVVPVLMVKGALLTLCVTKMDQTLYLRLR